MNTYREKHKV